MRASSAHHTHRPGGPVPWPVSVLVIAALSALCWWGVHAIVGVALGLHP